MADDGLSVDDCGSHKSSWADLWADENGSGDDPFLSGRSTVNLQFCRNTIDLLSCRRIHLDTLLQGGKTRRELKEREVAQLADFDWYAYLLDASERLSVMDELKRNFRFADFQYQSQIKGPLCMLSYYERTKRCRSRFNKMLQDAAGSLRNARLVLFTGVCRYGWAACLKWLVEHEMFKQKCSSYRFLTAMALSEYFMYGNDRDLTTIEEVHNKTMDKLVIHLNTQADVIQEDVQSDTQVKAIAEDVLSGKEVEQLEKIEPLRFFFLCWLLLPRQGDSERCLIEVLHFVIHGVHEPVPEP